MAEKSVVDLIEEWQTGFFVVLGSAIVGILSGLVVGSLVGGSGPGFVLGFIGGLILSFLAYSYLRYGR